MTVAQIALKPMTVAMEETISSLADSRQGRIFLHLRRPDRMHPLPIVLHATEMLLSA
jgi:hypothetical protein